MATKASEKAVEKRTKYSEAELLDIDFSDPAVFEEFEKSLGLKAADATYERAFPRADVHTLVGVPLYFLQWRFGFSQAFGADYVVVWAVRGDTREQISIVDFGQGIREQLSQITERRENKGIAATCAGLRVPSGLRVSAYPAKFDDATGEMIRPAGETAYLA